MFASPPPSPPKIGDEIALLDKSTYVFQSAAAGKYKFRIDSPTATTSKPKRQWLNTVKAVFVACVVV